MQYWVNHNEWHPTTSSHSHITSHEKSNVLEISFYDIININNLISVYYTENGWKTFSSFHPFSWWMTEVPLHWVFLAPNDCIFIISRFPLSKILTLNYICSHDQLIPFSLLYELPRKETKHREFGYKKENKVFYDIYTWAIY